MNEILIGDCVELMKQFVHAGHKVQTCITSPPYFGLRDYKVEGQIGLEETPGKYVGRLLEVFRLVRELLGDDGTLWLNLGDSYTSGGRDSFGTFSEDSKQATHPAIKSAKRAAQPPGLKPKDLIGIPWRVAFALQADGWYLRSDIIWNKPNPMPESVTDRPTKSHEYLFLLSKSADYYYDQKSILEPVSLNTHLSLAQNIAAQIGSARANGGAKTNGNMKAVGRKVAAPGLGIEANTSFESAVCLPVQERNKRSVWTVTTQPYSGAHFATFPPELILPCVLAGARPGDVVFDPFMGSGTTALVAKANGRKYLGCELNPEYRALWEERLSQEVLYGAEVGSVNVRDTGGASLFDGVFNEKAEAEAES